MRTCLPLVLILAIAGCGDDDEAPVVDAAPIGHDATIDAVAADAPPASTFTLTSAELATSDPPTEFPVKYTCAGEDVSLPLTWTAGPEGTAAYAVVLLDTDNDVIHWVIWDLKSALRGLPEAVPQGETIDDPEAKQSVSYRNVHGYLGPCPGGDDHVYTFTAYAIDVATLPGVDPNSDRDDLVAALEAHKLASATLSGHSDASR